MKFTRCATLLFALSCPAFAADTLPAAPPQDIPVST